MVDVAKTLRHLEQVADRNIDEAIAEISRLPPDLAAASALRLLQASLRAERGDLDEAVRLTRTVVVDEPNNPDGHHFLACLFEELDHPEKARDHFLTTLKLDRLAWQARPSTERQDLLDEVGRHVRSTVQRLPSQFREGMTAVPILIEPLPDDDLVEDGFDPRSLGVFEGPDHALRGSPDVHATTTRIVLFAENLAAEFPHPEDFADQIRITVLHEIGHYFGLDEDDMVRLGLD
jgi:predicted Zn-dependent protease with MMP-like domain